MPFAAPGLGTPGSQPAAPSREAFAEVVRRALRDFAHPDRLATNPRLRHAYIAKGREPASPTALQALLREAVASLAANPRDRKFHRAVWHTYLEPAPTQERAAELLGLPFNTTAITSAKAWSASPTGYGGKRTATTAEVP